MAKRRSHRRGRRGRKRKFGLKSMKSFWRFAKKFRRRRRRRFSKAKLSQLMVPMTFSKAGSARAFGVRSGIGKRSNSGLKSFKASLRASQLY